MLVVAALLAVGGVLFGYRVPLSTERLRREVIATLSDRLESEVELASIDLQLFPRLRISGSGLILRHRRRLDVPLIAVRTFHVTANVRGLLKKRIANVTLEGLEIQIASGRRDEASAPASATVAGLERRTGRSQILIDTLVADAATVTIIPRDTAKRPRTWQLHQLRLRSVGLDRAMPFESRLTNAVPPGTIDTNGVFGPWNASEPGRTPIDGAFTFDNADLGVFKGISGTLQSRGTYTGTLQRIVADGKTTTPDFTLDISEHPVALNADYQVVVDGTNGNTTLSRIAASFLNSSLVATGSVIDAPGEPGRTVLLDVEMSRARLEDILWLAVRTPTPTMTGALTLRTAFELPPGPEDVLTKLHLNGEFTVEDGRFTDATVQRQINTLSGRARGNAEDVRRVSSTFRGQFNLADGRLRLAPLRFDIPGALVDIRGEYALRPETLSFAGQVLMDARISQTQTGWKAVLLKPLDPLFRRNGRTFVPVTIRGSRSAPKFGIDVKRIFNKDRPPQMTRP